ncbi:MAG: ABC transporter ATP-binding protein [bacterium]|nr:ABC transporter ATP-binding protein [bacterium]
MSVAIRVDRLSKLFRRTTAGHKLRTLKSALVERSLVRGLRPEESITAIDDVSFTVEQGEAVGLIGSNGSGKSTLLKIVAGILRPTRGTVRVRGRTAALIELGAGFHPEISGRENIYINGAVLGLSRREIDRRYDEIVEFSGLADFIEEPVKNYSSGMYVRLGFAVAVHIEPDVLLVDEVLAVGDEAFAHRSLRRIEELLGQGRTLLLVSHSLSLIEEVCDRAIWLEGGEQRLNAHPRRVVDAYRQSVAEAEGRLHHEAKVKREEEGELRDPDHPEGETPEVAEAPAPSQEKKEEEEEEDKPVLRWGSGEAEIERVRILVDGEERYHVTSGDAVVFEIEARAQRRFTDFVFGIALTTPRGVECWGTNTDLDGFVPARLAEGPVTVHLRCPELRLAPGEYLVDVAVHARDGTPYDYRRRLLAFSVTSRERGIGVYFPQHEWSFSEGIAWTEGTAQDS